MKAALAALACCAAAACAAPPPEPARADPPVTPRARVIVDNDFGGDPDGLFQLAHHLLSPSVEIRGIIGSRHYESGFYGAPGDAAYACELARELLRAMGMEGAAPVLAGAESVLASAREPADSDGARLIVAEAMREDTELPLYVACGGGLTNIASAYLLEPRIAQRLRLVWIGGPEYEAIARPPPGAGPLEYNLGIDRIAAQVVFNDSDLPLWQAPRDAYRQTLASYHELLAKVKPMGRAGAFLMEKLEEPMRKSGGSLGEAYALGDNPLVLLTALQSSWDADPSSSRYELLPAPRVGDDGRYRHNPQGRPIRVYDHLDTRLMLEDFYAKLALLARRR